MKLKYLASWKKSYDKPRQYIKKQRHYFANKGPSNQSYGFSSSHVWMWQLEHKESWVPKNWGFWTMMLNSQDSWEFLGLQGDQTSQFCKGNQSWILIGRTDAEAEAPILWPPDWGTDSLEKTIMLGKIEGRRRRGWQRMRWLVAPPTRWAWVWASFRNWWWTRRPGMLQSMGSQKFGHAWATELNWKTHCVYKYVFRNCTKRTLWSLKYCLKKTMKRILYCQI